MFKRLINFLLLANGITPTGHKEKDKWSKLREDRERFEREQADRNPAPDHHQHKAGNQQRPA